MKYLLVTGGAGFVGANFLHYFLNKYPDYHTINLDKLTYSASIKNIAGLPPKQHTLIRGDICDALLLKDIFSARKIEGIINFAVESPTESSIIPPYQFIKTNIEGTFTLLETARKNWLSTPNQYKADYQNARFCQISSDSVYGISPAGVLAKESAPFAPQSPFSASKASADLLVQSYHNTYGINTIVVHSTNNYGPFQHDEKFIPTVIRCALFGQAIPVYGTGQNVRDWLFTEDNSKAVDTAFHQGVAGQRYNAASGMEIANITMAQKICRILDDIIPNITGKPYGEQIQFIAEPKWHAARYGADSDKIQYALNWQPKAHFDEAIKDTVLFYINKYKTL